MFLVMSSAVSNFRLAFCIHAAYWARVSRLALNIASATVATNFCSRSLVDCSPRSHAQTARTPPGFNPEAQRRKKSALH